MKKLLRLLATPLFAAALVLTAFSGPARADVPESDAELAVEWQAAWDTYRFYDSTPPPLPGSGRSRDKARISIEIDAPVEHVFAAYSDINHHIGMHSFLKRVVTHGDRSQGGTRTIDFTAIEEIPYQGTIVTSKTHAQQRIDHAGLRYETDTWSLPGVVTHQKILFKELDNGKTEVTEHLTFDADTSLIDFVVTNGVASHEQTQAALKQAIESGEL
ncbi:SRPBCC family protein [Streptosporangium canum]|uniref:SRPBCC family protein n=1 Tax=Streptosporangium canum TaxID=324952 RepID=UPI00343672E4